jgi:hypothetical protein
MVAGCCVDALGSTSFSAELKPPSSLSLETLDLTGPLGVDNLVDRCIYWLKASFIMRFALGESQLRVV